MPQRRFRLTAPDGAEIAASFAALRESMGVALRFPTEVLEEAERAIDAPRLPERDHTSIPFVTVDPAGSMDLDQAFHLERKATGYRVRYAIADVAAFVTPGEAMDREAHARGQTLYAPDRNARLYPRQLSEGAGSLLPDRTRPALVWDMTVDETGEGTEVTVERALVRSRAKLDYEGVQASLDAGTAGESLQLLREVGSLRQAREERRGGVELPVPEQIVEKTADGYRLSFRAPLPVERWNAQLSLMTGMAAAELMLDAGIGVLRTLPAADDRAVARLRRTAHALGVAWPDDEPYPEFLRRLDAHVSEDAAVLSEATVLLRGSGYVAFDGSSPKDAVHAGSPRRTRTPQPRCDGSSTATWERCASRSPRAKTCPAGRARRCLRCPRRWSAPTSARTSTRAGSSPPSRRRCWRRASAAPSRRSWSRSTSMRRAASSSSASLR